MYIVCEPHSPKSKIMEEDCEENFVQLESLSSEINIIDSILFNRKS
ncbi:hypothetical protein MNB_SV-14-126 [hydrothermal vent metagenome]|uniref:Uncharacterized protein n=1 Tax=hydrothermal vent metagenome TaxID=652676 RepID=A0A1W1BM60_9ZZZZ